MKLKIIDWNDPIWLSFFIVLIIAGTMAFFMLIIRVTEPERDINLPPNTMVVKDSVFFYDNRINFKTVPAPEGHSPGTYVFYVNGRTFTITEH